MPTFGNPELTVEEGGRAVWKSKAFVAGTPFSVLDAPHFIASLRFDSEHLMAGHGIKLERGWIHHATFSLWYGVGAPVLVAGVVGVFVLARRSWRTALFLCASYREHDH